MKKACIVSFPILAVLMFGCSVSDDGQGNAEGKPAVVRAGSSYFWDKDLRPTVAVPARRRTQSEPLAQVTEPQAGPAVQATPAVATPGAQSGLMTASVAEMRPVRPHRVPSRSAPNDRVAFGSGLVALQGEGEHILSMTYPRPDYGLLQIDKAMPKEVRFNIPFDYVIKVTNLTDMMLTDVVITETLSREFEFKGSDPTAVTENGNLIWEIDSLGPRSSKSIRISGVATGARQLEHCTAVTHTMRDCAVVKVVEPALELVKIAPTEALLCEPIPIEFVVTNTGTGSAENVQVIDTLPTGMQTADGKSKVILEAGTLVAGESRRFTIKLRAMKTGAYVNKATATSAAGLKAESEATLTNVRQPVLVITKSGPNRQYLGRPIAYEITVRNQGDGPARDTVIEEAIPAGVTAVEATAGAQSSGSKLVWQLGTIEPNASKTVRVSYRPIQEGEVMATATVTAYCAEPASDSIKTSVYGMAAVRLNVIDLEDPVGVGDTTTYVITVSNEGSAADTNIRIACALDDKLQYVSSAGATAGSIMGKTVSFAPLRILDPKGTATWRVVVRGAKAGDVRFRVTTHTDHLAVPVEHVEATHIYQQ